MFYTVFAVDTFFGELGRTLREIQNAWNKHILDELRKGPIKQDPSKIKRLTGYNNHWRYKISYAYRLV